MKEALLPPSPVCSQIETRMNQLISGNTAPLRARGCGTLT